MKISFDYYGIKKKFSNTREAREVIEYVVRKENKTLGEIVVILTNNSYLLKINQDFLKHNYFTDVITFGKGFKNYIAGEIYISIDQVQINAINYHVPPREELFRVIIHGVLHLIGYTDDNEQDRKLMGQKEDTYLEYMRKRGFLVADEFTI